MRTILFALAGLSLSFAAPASAPADSMLASIQSADSVRQASIRIELSGALFKSLGFAPGDFGTLSLAGKSGTATGTLRAELSDYPGAMDFSSSAADPELEVRVWPSSGATVPRLKARGHLVRIVRSADGVLAVQAIR